MRDEVTDEDSKAMKEWLAKGNKVTICPPMMRSDPEEVGYTWGKKKKKAAPKPVDKAKK
tara:strand:- start:5861 stop:6037 length:177 start_codon:yes stop_codon:yes gene_type:complete